MLPLLLSFLFSQVHAQAHTGIEYSDQIAFNWGMFKGRADDHHLSRTGSRIGAVTVSTISYTMEAKNQNAKVRIAALFNPLESWTLYPHLENQEEALIHEKRHFQICEIYARKFRQLVSKTQFHQRTFTAELESLFKKVTAEYKEEQARYDRETNHSLDVNQQDKWNKYIDRQLQASAPFSTPTISVVLN